MKKHFYQKTSYLVFNVIMLIVISIGFILNSLGYMSTYAFRVIDGSFGLFFVAVFIYMIYCAIKDKKLRNQTEPVVSIEPAAGVLSNPGDAIITVDGFRYLIESPFCKEGVTPNNGDTFYSYLSSLRLLEPISKKMIKWFKKDMKISDTIVNEHSLCYFFRDFRVVDASNPLFLCNTSSDKMMLIVAIEQLNVNNTPRSLEHITALINAVSDHERNNYAGGGLLDAFNLFKDGKMTPKMFKHGNNVEYVFLYKN